MLTIEKFIQEHLSINVQLYGTYQEQNAKLVPYNIRPNVKISFDNPVKEGTKFVVNNITACYDKDKSRIVGLNCLCTDEDNVSSWITVNNPNIFNIVYNS